MSYQDSFEKVKALVDKLDASMVDGHYAYEFDIIGDDEGKFYVEINGGKIVAQPYDYIDNDAMVTAPSAEIIKYFSNEKSDIEVSGDKLDILTTIIINSAPKKKAKTTAAKPTAPAKACTAKTTATKTTAAKKTTKTTRKKTTK